MIKFIYTWFIIPFITKFPDIRIKNLGVVVPDSEFDIEHEAIVSIDRDCEDDETLISYYPKDGSNLIECYMTCTISQHNEYVKRLRIKLTSDTQINR